MNIYFALLHCLYLNLYFRYILLKILSFLASKSNNQIFHEMTVKNSKYQIKENRNLHYALIHMDKILKIIIFIIIIIL